MIMSEKQRGMHWTKENRTKGTDTSQINSFAIDKEIDRKRDRIPTPDLEGEVGSVEWWSSIRENRQKIAQQIEEMKRVKGGGDKYVENIRKWTELLLRLDKMIGDAIGVFFKDSKHIQPGGVNNFIVFRPDQHLESKKIENVAVEVIDMDGGEDE